MFRINFLASITFGLAALVGVAGNALAQSVEFETELVADFEGPWAMEFLPDGRLLVTERGGSLKLFEPGSGEIKEITGTPEAVFDDRGGLGDIVLHPEFSKNQYVYLSFAEPGDDGSVGAAVGRARLILGETGGSLSGFEVIWRQVPKLDHSGNYGHRIALRDGYVWITAGARFQSDAAQDLNQTLGKIVRLYDDGRIPPDNPFADRAGVAAQVWSLGHRNPLGLAFDASGQLWETEMGPQGGDELNRIERGANYGWPLVSNGVNYGGGPIPDHDTRPDFHPPSVYWLRDDTNRSISPSNIMFYDGAAFPSWRGNAFIGGLLGEYISRIELEGDTAREVERLNVGIRVRDVAEGPDGAIWVLEDERQRGGEGRLFKLTPAAATDN